MQKSMQLDKFTILRAIHDCKIISVYHFTDFGINFVSCLTRVVAHEVIPYCAVNAVLRTYKSEECRAGYRQSRSVGIALVRYAKDPSWSYGLNIFSHMI